jgi:hypothetical protein
MFYSRFAFVRKIRPVLYFSDAGRATIPQFLSFGSESIIVNGSNSREDETWKDITMGRASFGKVENGCLTYSGRRVALP